MKPDYNGGSIVNLMASIMSFLGKHSIYPESNFLNGPSLEKYDNVVFFVIDGLGHDWLLKNKPDSFLAQKCIGKITSVFPTTTACAVTTFLTGLAPQQHGITGWNMRVPKFKQMIKTLRFQDTFTSNVLDYKHGDLYDFESIFYKSSKRCFVVMNSDFEKSPYNKVLNSPAEVLTYSDVESFFSQTESAVKSSTDKKYIYSYWPDFDSIRHHLGGQSSELASHFDLLNYGFQKFSKNIAGTNTLVIVIADHGQVDIPNSNKILIEDYPEILETLQIPMLNVGGVDRQIYCYIKPELKQRFFDLVSDKRSEFCEVFPSLDLLEKNYWGVGYTHPDFLNRIGDFVLITKKNYLILQKRNGEYSMDISAHGGTSKSEMLVPLMVF